MDFIKGQRRETERKGQYIILRGVLALGILMRLIYVLYTPYTMGQHDTMELGSGSGHFGYIEYFLQGGSLLFDFNPMNAYEFYHPPLFLPHFKRQADFLIPYHLPSTRTFCGFPSSQALKFS